MPKLFALPRPAAAVLALLLTAALPATSLASPPESSGPPLVVSPSPVTFPKTTVGYQTPSQEIALANQGEEEAPIEKVYIDGEDSAAFNFSGHNCGTLYQGQHCSLWISFTPGSAGEKHATVHVQFKNGRPEETFDLFGTAVPAQLNFQPGSHDFGTQWVYSGSEASFQLQNTGEAAVQLNTLDIIGPDSHAFWTGNSDCWGWIEPGESCSVQVNFQPGDTVAYEAAVRAGVNGESFTAALSGRGGRAIVEASANPFDFGAATVGSESETRAITLTNSGDLPGAFFIGIIAGGDAGSFRLVDENCSGAPLPPSASCVAHVRFTPQDPGPKAARLALFGENDGGTMIALTGEGVAPAVTLAPSSYDFGPQAKDNKSAPRYFAVRNEGGTPVDLGTVAIVGSDLDQFALSGDNCTGITLGGGEQCLVRVRFAPDSVGAQSATLRIGGSGGVYTASLSGRGTVVRAADPRATNARHLARAKFRHGNGMNRAPRRVGLIEALIAAQHR